MTWMIHLAYLSVIITLLFAIARLLDKIDGLHTRNQIAYETYTEYKKQRDQLAEIVAKNIEDQLI